FWVVLGTLSVLRSNALGTGWSIITALAGTAVGIVIGALLVIGIGTHEAVLWGVLPVALLLAAYAPRAISFAAGQAGFTVVLFVLFNLIQPVGWRVGLVRIEDVAIGFAISLGVGLLFWPRGAGALLREDLAAALGRMADGKTRLERCGENLDRELHALQSWYVTLGYALVNARPVPPPHIRDAEGSSRLLACVRDAARGRDKETVKAALVLLWAS